MGGGKLVLPVGPALLGVGERRPAVGEPRRGDLGEHRHERGERLVQPQVVPPAHRHEVAEPHVGHLVQDRLGPPLPAGLGDLRAEDVVLQERHTTGVLHRSGVELGDEELVVLAERVTVVEHPVVEVEPGLGDREDLVRVEELGQGLPAVQAEVDPVVVVPDLVVGAGDQRGDVGRDDRRGLEEPQRPPGAGVRGLQPASVRDTRPAGRGHHRELEYRLQVRLVETGVHPVGVIGLELGVQVAGTVDRVDEPVQALAGLRVGAVGRHLELVDLPQIRKGDPVPVVHLGRVQALAVEGHRADSRGDQLDEGGGTRLGTGEAHRCP